MDKELGSTFIYKGKKLQVSEVENSEFACAGCYFWEHNIPCLALALDCTDDSRKDNKNVIFKLK